MSKKKPTINQLDPTVVSEVFVRRVAVLSISGSTAKQIGEQYGFSEAAIKALQERDDYKELVQKAGEQEMTFSLAKLKTRLMRMGDKAAKVYEKVMDDYLEGRGGARDAVNVAQSITRALGADKGENQQTDATLTVVLPGGSEIVTIPTEKVKDETNTTS